MNLTLTSIYQEEVCQECRIRTLLTNVRTIKALLAVL